MDESAMGPITTDDEFSETTWNTRDVNQGGRVMDNIARQRITETHIRKQDASDLVDEYHKFEDKINLLEDENRLKDEKLENAEAEVAECLILLKNLHDLCDWNGISSTWMDDAAKIIGLEGVE